MKTKLTQSDITPAMKSAVTAYLLAKAHAQVMREEVDKIERAVLEECPLTNGLEVEHGQPPRKITDPKDVWLCDDDNTLEEYYQDVDHRLREAGLKPESMPREHCPALVAEDMETKAKWLICDASADMMDLEYDGKELNSRLLSRGLDEYQRFIDLNAKLVVNLPDFKSPVV